MNLFNNFNIQTFKNKKPPTDNSMSTFKEINEINKMPVNEKFVKYNDDQEKVFKDIFKKNNLKFPDQLFCLWYLKIPQPNFWYYRRNK